MNLNMPFISSLVFILLFTLPLFTKAQHSDWKEATAKGGTVKVKYKVEAPKDSDKAVVAQYWVKGNVNFKLDKAEKFLRNSANYKTFLDNTEVSKTVGTISKNEWLLYLFMDIPWPMPDADCVQQVSIARSSKELIVNAIAKPNAYPLQGEERMHLSDIKYHFVENAAGAVELTITGKFSPVGPITKFMLETWFPNGPVQLIERLEEQINAL
jgi:hypothetical protein